jgi:hypothetical protein
MLVTEDDTINSLMDNLPSIVTSFFVYQTEPVNANKLSPDVPEEPSLPEVPIAPSAPLVPEVPSVPLLPLVPEEPSVPLEPDVPEEPSVPFEPEVPAVPVKPGIPNGINKNSSLSFGSIPFDDN